MGFNKYGKNGNPFKGEKMWRLLRRSNGERTEIVAVAKYKKDLEPIKKELKLQGYNENDLIIERFKEYENVK